MIALNEQSLVYCWGRSRNADEEKILRCGVQFHDIGSSWIGVIGSKSQGPEEYRHMKRKLHRPDARPAIPYLQYEWETRALEYIVLRATN
jgi:hypothetical protein